ncbi:MAG TPA: VWA domain-containing protein [Candidatus Sumerlaeota bacterium]|nr:VWA domain-containing protein [Candidatus Sumerlaeota bacterium]
MNAHLQISRFVGLAGLMLLAATAGARQVALEVQAGQPLLKAGEKQTAYLMITLTGPAVESASERPPANVAIVLDKSGSMGGEKIAEAREAALLALERLDKEDIVSIVAYDTDVRVVLPATRLRDREQIETAIRGIEAGGNTALYGGVSRGAEELRKFQERDQVNRLILLSDGLANVGPATPEELAALGRELGGEGLPVTTIGLGLGYNEDLMYRLAEQSDGNHVFAERASDLASLFDEEFGSILQVVARDLRVAVRCGEGVRPVRVLGRDAEIDGRDVMLELAQLHGARDTDIILEVEVPAREAGDSLKLAEVEVEYRNLLNETDERLTSEVSARFTDSSEAIEKAENDEVMARVVQRIAAERNALATKLRDQGEIDKAREILITNEAYLKEGAARYDAPGLGAYAEIQADDAANLEGENWERQRKSMRSTQYQMFR